MTTTNTTDLGKEPSGALNAQAPLQPGPVSESPIVVGPKPPATEVRENSEENLENPMELNSTDILNLYRDHATIERNVLKEASDIRQEVSKGHGEIKYAIAEHSESTNRDILTTGHNNQVKIDEAADKIQQRATDFYLSAQARDFDAARDVAALKAATDMAAQKLSTEILLSAERGATAAALESAKVAAAVALGQSQLSKEIAESKFELSKQVGYENEKTRDLINSLKNDELNRLLIERNTDLQHCRHDYWGARDGLFNTQFAALSSQVNSQLNALNSQIAETRQGMVNFGTMAGVGQSSTSNAVR
jgi:hypothetical protein